MAAVQKHRGLEAGPGSKAGIHENHREHLLLQPTSDLTPFDPAGEREQLFDLSEAPVLQGQKVALGHWSTAWRPEISRSASWREKESGGSSRNTWGSVEVPVRIL